MEKPPGSGAFSLLRERSALRISSLEELSTISLSLTAKHKKLRPSNFVLQGSFSIYKVQKKILAIFVVHSFSLVFVAMDYLCWFMDAMACAKSGNF